MTRRVLVTGVAGFIGGALATRLACEADVVGIDNFFNSDPSRLPEGISFIEGDCQDPRVYAAIDGKFDVIYHVAGQASAAVSYDDPVYDLQTNSQSTLALLDQMNRWECTRLIYASTMSVYGVQPDRPISEQDSCVPASFYGVGKIASEHYLRLYAELGINSTALRLFNVYGPGQNLENLRQGMVSIYLAQALKCGHIEVKGSPKRYRDFTYIDDVVDAFLQCSENSVAYGKIYNVGTGRRMTVEALIAQINSVLNGDITVSYHDETSGDQFGIFADASLIYQDVGWCSKVAVEEGLQMMVEWAKTTQF